jgi:hypothetical protein
VPGLFKRFAAIPFHGVGHGWSELVEVRGGTPKNIMMFRGRESEGAVFWTGPVNHPDVFMSVSNAMDIQKARSD